MKKMETSDDKILKENLRKSAESYKAQLAVEVSESMNQLERILKTTAVVAGGALIGYSIFKILFETEDEKKKDKKNRSAKTVKSDFFRPLVKAGAEVVATYVLAIARQKLKEYINNLKETETSSNGHSSGNH